MNNPEDMCFLGRSYDLVIQNGHPRPATTNQVNVQCLAVYEHAVQIDGRDTVLDVILGHQLSQHWLLFVMNRQPCMPWLRKAVETRVETHAGFCPRRVYGWRGGAEVASFLARRQIRGVYTLSVACVPALRLLPVGSTAPEPNLG